MICLVCVIGLTLLNWWRESVEDGMEQFTRIKDLLRERKRERWMNVVRGIDSIIVFHEILHIGPAITPDTTPLHSTVPTCVT
jgi:hypothetical protein